MPASASNDSLDSRFEGFVMMKGHAIAVVCFGMLVAVDHEVYGGQHTSQVLQMLQQIRFAFGL